MALSPEERRRKLRAASEKRRHMEHEDEHHPQDSYYNEERQRAQRRLRAERRRRRQRRQRIMAIVAVIVGIALLCGIIFLVRGLLSGGKDKDAEVQQELVQDGGAGSQDGMTELPEESTEPETEDARLETMAEAERLAAMYDYDGAIELLGTLPEASTDQEIQALVAGYEETRQGWCVRT